MLLLNCALKLVEEIILYYDARSKKHQITNGIRLLLDQQRCKAANFGITSTPVLLTAGDCKLAVTVP